MKLRIHTVKDTSVRQVAKQISAAELATRGMQDFADALSQAMIDFNGIGIAACQVGKAIRLIVIDKTYSATPEHLVLANPRIVSTSKKTTLMEEGCLSVPGVFGSVERFVKVRVKALTRDGTPIDIKAKGKLAHILQHEVDHTNAIVFIDKAVSLHEPS